MPEPVSEKKVVKPLSVAEGEPSMRRPSGYGGVRERLRDERGNIR